MTTEELEFLLPPACAWVEEQERIILNSGIPLNASQLADAKQIGIVQPERVRLLLVPAIPISSLHPKLIPLVPPQTDGLTARYGIFIRADCIGNRVLVAHELVHTKQYEQFGGIEGFLRPYLTECLVSPGYPNGRMEQEAVIVSEKLCPK